jgi:hypothetical protein
VSLCHVFGWATQRSWLRVLAGAHVSSPPFLAKGPQPWWYAKAVDDAREGVCPARAAKCRATIREPRPADRTRSRGVVARATGMGHAWLALWQERRMGVASRLPARATTRLDPAGHPATLVVARALCLHRTAPAGPGGVGAERPAARRGLPAHGPLRSPRPPVAVRCRGRGAARLAHEAPLGGG